MPDATLNPVKYDTFARFADWFHGWRDGRVGIPRLTEPPLSTPHREVLIRLANEAFEHERLAHEARCVADRQRVASATLAHEQAGAALARARQRLLACPVPDDAALTARRPGEEQRKEQMIRLRRTREYARLRAAREGEVRAALAREETAARDLAAAREALRRHELVADVRVRRVHEHIHRRMATYRRRLVRGHPNGPLISEAMDVLFPHLPDWLPNPADDQVPGQVDATIVALPQHTAKDHPEAVVFALRDLLSIGSSEQADVVIAGPNVAPRHAEVRRSGAEVWLHDFGRGIGTFQEGRRVLRSRLAPGDVFEIGDFRFELGAEADTLVRIPLGSCELIVHNLSHETTDPRTKRPRRRLTLMSFTQREKSVLAVLGPSGAGKSSLFAALLDELPRAESSGAIYFRGMNVRSHIDQIRERLGFVPQEDSLHRSLTVRQSLGFAYRLRRPADRTIPLIGGERDTVRAVCRQLDIEGCLDQTIDSLSGGQRKRVSIAMELLAKPRLLMLDEPTSGLDPGMDLDVMRELRKIARNDCTVIVVTHATQNLNQADRVLMLATDGRPVYCGPPGQLPGALGEKSYADLMKALGAAKAEKLAADYRQGPEAAEAARRRQDAKDSEPHPGPPDRTRGPLAVFTRQFPGMLARQLALTFPLMTGRHLVDGWRRRKWDAVMTFMPLAVTVVATAIAAWVVAGSGLAGGAGRQASAAASTSVSMLTTLCVLTGLALSYTNLVEEYSVIRREHRTGMRVAAIVASKWLVFAAIAVVQAVLMTWIWVIVRPGPLYGLAGLSPDVALFVPLAGTGVAAMSLGLLISASCRDLKQAVTITSLIVILQVALNGISASLSGRPAANIPAMLVAPSRWGAAAVAASADLRRVAPLTASADQLWQHTTGQWINDLVPLAVMTIAFTVLATVRLHRRLARSAS